MLWISEQLTNDLFNTGLNHGKHLIVAAFGTHILHLLRLHWMADIFDINKKIFIF